MNVLDSPAAVNDRETVLVSVKLHARRPRGSMLTRELTCKLSENSQETGNFGNCNRLNHHQPVPDVSPLQFIYVMHAPPLSRLWYGHSLAMGQAQW